MSTKKAPTPVVVEPSGRILRSKQKFHIDHFKLLVGTKIADVSPQAVRQGDGDHAAVYVKQEHCHFYHTYDSNGKKQTKCSFIAGHTHEITEVPQGPGNPPKIVVGPAVKEVRTKDKKTKEWKISFAAADDDKETIDQCHKHEWEYMFSEETEGRDMNKEALQLQGIEAQKGAPVPGVLG